MFRRCYVTGLMKRRLHAVRRADKLIKTSTYEISSQCNLRCEGCLFFSGEHAYQHSEEESADVWRTFFRMEAERGITFAFLAGAEPALAIDRLRAAWEFIPSGMVVTNGTRLIPKEIGFRIHVSLWGTGESSALTRGGDVTQKAFRNYAFDPRAVFVYTINPLNLDEIMPMARACRNHGVPMTFNYYAPTAKYQQELASSTKNDSDYFRFSNSKQNLVMTQADYRRAREIIEKTKNAFPETIIYSMAYDAWITGENVFDLDSDGIATNCAGRSDRVHSTFFVDQTKSNLKCSNPTFDCRECRTYASGMTSHIRIEHLNTLRPGYEGQWSDAFECWDNIFVGNQWQRIKQKVRRSSLRT